MLVLLGLVLFPGVSPAPFIYRPGEGWIYEPVGSEGKWIRGRAKDQLEVAKQALEKKEYKLACRAAKRVVTTWPLSDYAPEANYILGRGYEARRQDERAFKVYEELLRKYPKFASHDEVLERQFQIATRFLNGQWFRLWNTIPLYPDRERTAELFSKIVIAGPYSDVAPKAQMSVGTAWEMRRDYASAVRAYTTAADRYHDRPQVAAEALFKAGMAYNKQARTADYDQSVASEAIATFTDFIALFPKDPRVPEAQKTIDALKTEQARGSFQIASFYEKKRRKDAALIYYNEVIVQDQNSTYASTAKQRIALLKNLPTPPPAAPVPAPVPATSPKATPAPADKPADQPAAPPAPQPKPAYPIRVVPGEPPPK